MSSLQTRLRSSEYFLGIGKMATQKLARGSEISGWLPTVPKGSQLVKKEGSSS